MSDGRYEFVAAQSECARGTKRARSNTGVPRDTWPVRSSDRVSRPERQGNALAHITLDQFLSNFMWALTGSTNVSLRCLDRALGCPHVAVFEQSPIRPLEHQSYPRRRLGCRRRICETRQLYRKAKLDQMFDCARPRQDPGGRAKDFTRATERPIKPNLLQQRFHRILFDGLRLRVRRSSTGRVFSTVSTKD
jgi:hypothetical protein